MKKTALFIMTALLAGSVLAGPPDLGMVAKGSKWAFHVDLTKARQTVIGKAIAGRLVQENKTRDNIAKFEKYAGKDAFSKVEGMTAYGFSLDREGVLLLFGKLDQQQIATVALAKGLVKSEYGQAAVFEKPDTGGAFALANENTIALAGSRSLLETAIDLVNGDSAVSADPKNFSLLNNWSESSFAAIESLEPMQMVGDDPSNKILKDTRQIGISLGEADGRFNIDWVQIATDSEKASQLQQLFQGLAAMVKLGNAEPEILSLVENLKIQRDQNRVSVNLNYPAEKLLSLAQEHGRDVDIKIDLDFQKESTEQK